MRDIAALDQLEVAPTQDFYQALDRAEKAQAACINTMSIYLADCKTQPQWPAPKPQSAKMFLLSCAIGVTLTLAIAMAVLVAS